MFAKTKFGAACSFVKHEIVKFRFKHLHTIQQNLNFVESMEPIGSSESIPPSGTISTIATTAMPLPSSVSAWKTFTITTSQSENLELLQLVHERESDNPLFQPCTFWEIRRIFLLLSTEKRVCRVVGWHNPIIRDLCSDFAIVHAQNFHWTAKSAQKNSADPDLASDEYEMSTRLLVTFLANRAAKAHADWAKACCIVMKHLHSETSNAISHGADFHKAFV